MSHAPSDDPAEAPDGPHGAPAGQGAGAARRWLAPVVALVLVVLVAAAAMVLLGRDGAGPAAPATPTLAPADAPSAPGSAAATAAPSAAPTGTTRTVSPDPLEPRMGAAVAGTVFTLAAPGWGPDTAATAAGAREALAGTYTDGTTNVPVTAAAFGTIEAQDAYSAALVADLDAAGATKGEEGSVYVDGTGHYWYYLLEDGVTARLVWRTDDGVVVTLTGPGKPLAELYKHMPL
ncbi:hypothetical protein [Georgenia sp. SYP-B2076]|uniref:hypothetical protein n=1 Tax=Georgenia sp. SYP-B2076 TaxID=2495881 RepID=UPI000F8CD1C6|nr:hypothetical protein [Georgenia sp. SYP-B2076]